MIWCRMFYSLFIFSVYFNLSHARAYDLTRHPRARLAVKYNKLKCKVFYLIKSLTVQVMLSAIQLIKLNVDKVGTTSDPLPT